MSSTIETVKIITNGVSFLLLMIGMLNFINVMITGVNSRKKELALLESVGMTKKQISKMLSMEGLYYAIIVSGVQMTIGNLVLLVIAKNIKSLVNYAKFTYPITILLLLLGIIFGICILVPRAAYKSAVKDKLVNRLGTVD